MSTDKPWIFEAPRFTQIPNNLLGHCFSTVNGGDKPGYMAEMSLSELRLALALLRLTWGFRTKAGLHRQVTRASLTRLQKLTGLSRPSVVAGAKALVKRGLFSKTNDGGVTRWSLVVKEVDYTEQVDKESNQGTAGNALASKETQPPSMKETKTQEKETSTESAERTPTTFREWHARIRDSKNRPAELMSMYMHLYHSQDEDDANLDLPSHGYMGTAARKVGGAGRLAELLWQHSTKPPTGDVLAYLMKVSKGNGNGYNRRNSQQHGQYTAQEIAASQAKAKRQFEQMEARDKASRSTARPEPEPATSATAAA